MDINNFSLVSIGNIGGNLGTFSQEHFASEEKRCSFYSIHQSSRCLLAAVCNDHFIVKDFISSKYVLRSVSSDWQFFAIILTYLNADDVASSIQTHFFGFFFYQSGNDIVQEKNAGANETIVVKYFVRLWNKQTKRTKRKIFRSKYHFLFRA